MRAARAWLEWLAPRPALAAAFAGVYAVATIAAHERVNQLVRAVQGALGRASFALVAWGGLALLGAVLVVGIARLPAGRRLVVAFAFAAWLAAAAVAYVYLFTVVSEAVHFAQYAGLTLLLFPLVGRPGAAMLAANLVGLADEANQFWVLHPDWGIYLDWNDIVLNALGALLGGLVLALAQVEPLRRAEPVASPGYGVGTRALCAATIAILLAAALAVFAGRIVLHAGAEPARAARAWLVLDRGDISRQPFWITAEWAQKRFHVMRPGAGAAAVAGFALLVAAVDRRIRGPN